MMGLHILHMRTLLACLSLTLVGCQGITRDINKGNLAKVNLGDTKAQVIEICGTPDKNEQFTKNGANYNVLFFYTDYIGEKSWEAGHTPILIKDGVVFGIGWRALKVNGIETSDISIETRTR